MLCLTLSGSCVVASASPSFTVPPRPPHAPRSLSTPSSPRVSRSPPSSRTDLPTPSSGRPPAVTVCSLASRRSMVSLSSTTPRLTFVPNSLSSPPLASPPVAGPQFLFVNSLLYRPLSPMSSSITSVPTLSGILLVVLSLPSFPTRPTRTRTASRSGRGPARSSSRS